MEWLTCIKEAIDYMENNLLTIKSPEEVAAHVNMSSMYLQKGFQILTGYSLGEYMRNRRMYLVALELSSSDEPIIDLAYKYGYETPASFDKAFTRFHGVTPMDVRKCRGNIRSFLRLSINICVQGGENMEFRIEKKEQLKVVGFKRSFAFENSYEMIPKFWEEVTNQYCSNLMQGKTPEGELEQFICQHRIGELGVCIDDIGNNGEFNYMIAGYADDATVPDGMEVAVIKAHEWAVFDCLMSNLQETNTRIWKEWLPGNTEYELAGLYNIECYSPDCTPGSDMPCQIWIPVKRK